MTGLLLTLMVAVGRQRVLLTGGLSFMLFKYVRQKMRCRFHLINPPSGVDRTWQRTVKAVDGKHDRGFIRTGCFKAALMPIQLQE